MHHENNTGTDAYDAARNCVFCLSLSSSQAKSHPILACGPVGERTNGEDGGNLPAEEENDKVEGRETKVAEDDGAGVALGRHDIVAVLLSALDDGSGGAEARSEEENIRTKVAVGDELAGEELTEETCGLQLQLWRGEAQRYSTELWC